MLAGGGLVSWVLWLAASSSSNQKDASTPTIITSSWHVCLSPGCVADGAHATLAKLKALAPPGTQICPGPCESQCGKGPIVTAVVNHETTAATTTVRANANQKKVIYSRMTGNALLDLLLLANNNSNSGIVPPTYDEMNPCLLEGYELVEQANDYFRIQHDYKRAIPLYEAGIELAVTPAMEMVQLDAEQGVLGDPNKDVEKEMWSVGRLEWLVRAYCDCAKAHLAEAAAAEDQKTMSMDRARVLAEAACDLSHRVDMDSLEQLAQVYQASNNPAGELNALQSLLDLPEEDAMSSSTNNNVANRRRLLGFRRAKLERELNSSS